MSLIRGVLMKELAGQKLLEIMLEAFEASRLKAEAYRANIEDLQRAMD